MPIRNLHKVALIIFISCDSLIEIMPSFWANIMSTKICFALLNIQSQRREHLIKFKML